MHKAGDRAQALYNQWADAFSTALENSTSGQTDVDGDVQNLARYSKDAETFKNDISQWDKEGKPENVSFILGSTGDVLQGLGAIESDIYMLGDKIKTILQDHPEMTLDEIKKIPQILENPVLILHSRGLKRGNRQNTRIVVFGMVKAKDGRYILSALDLRPQEGDLVIDDMQKVTSAYTKDTQPVNYIKKSKILYADKNTTAKLLRSIGFRMPIELQQSGYIGSITYHERSVNIYGKSFSEVFSVGIDPDTQAQARRVTKEQDTVYMDAANRGDTETAQKMVDEAAKSAGYTYRLYHGTNADFTKFDLRKHGGKNGKGEGYGIYLAANREISAPYGKNVIDAFVKFNRLAEGRTKTLSYAEVKNLVKRSCEIEAKQMVEDEEYDSVTDALKDTWVSNVVYTYDYANMEQVYTDVANKVWKGNNNDGDIINEIMALSGAHYDYDNAIKFYDDILTPVTGIDGFHYIWGNEDGSGVQNDIYLAFKSEQIKSSDPITYDDNGNVIPLSERFNPENEDIRYQVRRRRNKNYLDVESRFGVAELVSKNKKYNKEKKKKPRK